LPIGGFLTGFFFSAAFISSNLTEIFLLKFNLVILFADVSRREKNEFFFSNILLILLVSERLIGLQVSEQV
jgi:hypothetical protein